MLEKQLPINIPLTLLAFMVVLYIIVEGIF
jgi:hypothetical protein